MNVQNSMSPILNAKHQQAAQAEKQMKAAVANKVAIQSSNLNLVDPKMAEQLQNQTVPMAYQSNGSVKNTPSNSLVDVKA